ncbi:hypothetical protein F4780DRAFT_729537 [Xylariomycetidae sp. FL0641]|nr:hypothetical protein F4780DRAFT_729537 [Xylariomycetidae sp. FL0641]
MNSTSIHSTTMPSLRFMIWSCRSSIRVPTRTDTPTNTKHRRIAWILIRPRTILLFHHPFAECSRSELRYRRSFPIHDPRLSGERWWLGQYCFSLLVSSSAPVPSFDIGAVSPIRFCPCQDFLCDHGCWGLIDTVRCTADVEPVLYSTQSSAVAGLLRRLRRVCDVLSVCRCVCVRQPGQWRQPVPSQWHRNSTTRSDHQLRPCSIRT